MSESDRVRIQLNGELREIPAGLTVTGLLGHLQLAPALVVVERNGRILRREEYAATGVAAGDTLELVHFVGGGSGNAEC